MLSYKYLGNIGQLVGFLMCPPAKGIDTFNTNQYKNIKEYKNINNTSE